MGRVPLHSWLVALLTVVAVVGCSSTGRYLPESAVSSASAAAPESPPAPAPPAVVNAPSPIVDYSVHLPPQAELRQPLTVLLALHGMGGNGPDFSRALVDDADRNGWVLVAPTVNYRDWRDPEQVRRDGADLLPSLKGLLDELPSQTGLRLRKRALVFGFSRGGQTAHRFALFYPSEIRGVVALSTGTYTLPMTRVRQGTSDVTLKFPYGVGDIDQYEGQPFDAAGVRQVGFWLGVGDRDNQSADVPHEWDPFIGTNRVERARAFSRALEQLGARAELSIFPNASHEVTDEMRGQAVAFLSHLP